MAGPEPNPFDGERIAHGRYRFGDSTRQIELRRYRFDYHVELVDPGDAEGLPRQALNADGFLFYLVPTETDPLEIGFPTEEAAKAWADRQLWGPVEWTSG